MNTIDYKKLSACIEDARRDFRRGDSDTAVIDPYKVTMLPLYKGAESGFKIEEKSGDEFKALATCTVGGSGYVFHDYSAEGENLYALIKAVETATGKETFPASGIQPWSWKGELDDRFLEERDEVFKVVSELNAALPLNTDGNTASLLYSAYEAKATGSSFDFRAELFDGEKMRYFDFSYAGRQEIQGGDNTGNTFFKVCEDWCKEETESNIVSLSDKKIVEFLNGNNSVCGILTAYVRPEPQLKKDKSKEIEQQRS